jgi:hypothetical protein
LAPGPWRRGVPPASLALRTALHSMRLTHPGTFSTVAGGGRTEKPRRVARGGDPSPYMARRGPPTFQNATAYACVFAEACWRPSSTRHHVLFTARAHTRPIMIRRQVAAVSLGVLARTRSRPVRPTDEPLGLRSPVSAAFTVDVGIEATSPHGAAALIACHRRPAYSQFGESSIRAARFRRAFARSGFNWRRSSCMALRSSGSPGGPTQTSV